MKQTTMKAAVLLLLCSVSIATLAQNKINVVTTAVPFLRISPDARAGGMGDAGIATTPDANSAFWNLAKVPFAKSRTAISATYTPWLKDLGLNDVYLVSLAGYYQLDEQQAMSSSVRYFSLGNIQFTDYAGNDLGSFRPREFSIDFGYTRKLTEKMGLGVAMRYINSNLAGGQSTNGVTYKAGNAVAGDISLYHSNVTDDKGGLAWGVVLSNLGSKIAYTSDALNKDYIPANLGLGVSYTSVFDEINRLQFALDINKLLVPTPPMPSSNPNQAQAELENAENLKKYRGYGVMESWFKSFSDGGQELNELMFSIGAEYTYDEQFMFRLGYFYEHPTKGNRKYFTVGAGLKYNMLGLNFSYLVPSGNGVNRNPLSNTLRFSLLFDLDQENTGSR